MELGKILDDVSFTCGVSFSDLELPGRLKNVCVRDHKCRDPIEELYYSCDFEPICINCASQNVQPSTEFFPLCPKSRALFLLSALRDPPDCVVVHACV